MLNTFKYSFLTTMVLLFFFSCERKLPDVDSSQSDTTKPEITIPFSKGEVIKHIYYTLSYNEENEQAEWVFYKLTIYMVNGTEERTEDFRPDSAVSTGSAELSDYKSSGYDRGHLCPAGDMKISHTAMSESFYLSNMSPQVPSFNRGIWETLESTVRNIVCHDSEIYVVTGPIFKNNKGFIGANRVTIPGYYYKVIYSPKNKKMIGFVLPNEKCEKEIKDFSVSVDDVEKLSGINFFPKLAPSLENTLESKFDISKWDLTPMPETVSK